MLVLSRKLNEQIVIGDNIRVTVVSIRGNQVRLGFEAPPEVLIFRDELRADHASDESPSGAAGRLHEGAGRSSILLANGRE
jgi:carbon storage regulator CsrA